MDEYLNELYKEDYLFDTYKGDFLPLIEDVDPNNYGPHSLDIWTGFYSTRPTFKF